MSRGDNAVGHAIGNSVRQSPEATATRCERRGQQGRRRRVGLRGLAGILSALLAVAALGASVANAEVQHKFLKRFKGDDVPSGPLHVASGIAASSSGDIYVADLNFLEGFASIVDVFGEEGTYAGMQITGSETPAGLFGFISFEPPTSSAGLAVDNSGSANDGDIYVGDLANRVVDRFNDEGKYVSQLNGSETPDGSFIPTGIAVDSAGTVYVADFLNNVIDVFDESGTYVRQIKDSSRILEPKGVAVDSSGTTYIIAQEKLLKYSASGSFQETLDEQNAQGVVVDPTTDIVYTFEFNTKQIAGFNTSGARVSLFTDPSLEDATVGGLAIGPSGKVSVVKTGFFGSEVLIFGPGEVAPAVETGTASEITQASAKLAGHVDPVAAEGGKPITDCVFEYGTTTSYGQTAPCEPAPPYSAPQNVTAQIAGLSPSTTYHYSVKAENEFPLTGTGEDRTFSTRGPAAIDAEWATARTKSATVRARINPFGLDTTCFVEYVDDAAFEASEWQNAMTVPCPRTVEAGFADEVVAVELTGLEIGATYHFRFVTDNATGGEGGMTEGAGRTFATFGIESFSVQFRDAGGNPVTDAGAHPYEMITTVMFHTTTDEEGEESEITANPKTVHVDLPPGFIGNPQSGAQCNSFQIEQESCPPAAEVGRLEAFTSISDSPTLEPTLVNLYNVVPARGVAAQFSGRTNALGQVFIDAGVRTGDDYGVSTDSINLTTLTGVTGARVRLWGIPADEAHTAERACPRDPETGGGGGLGCKAGIEPQPFLSLPTSCTGPLRASVRADAWQEEGAFASATTDIPGMEGCGALDFSPGISLRPDTVAADSPAGLHVDLEVPQSDDPEGHAEAHLKDTKVVLPEGVAVNPAAANGLGACTPEQVGLSSGVGQTPIRFTPDPASCPDAAKVGAVQVETPLLDHPLQGGVYVAAPHDNPFGSLLAIYIAVHDPESGVVVKLAGKVEPDPRTGQLTATFNENPQLPFEHFKLDFFGGPHASLKTPVSCGTFTTTTQLRPWSSPEGEDASPSDTFEITEGPGGAPCVGSEAEAPHRPGLEAGTQTPLAGGFSPFVLKLQREDGTQRFSALNVALPPGLAGKIAGIPYCPEGALAAAAAKAGREELASPSCPADSELGRVIVGAGAGPDPYYVTGKAYLAGPYKGAPLSLVIVTPAVAGPFDLGTVVVRSALFVDPTTAAISVRSDPLPTILEGIPLDVRDIRVVMDRPRFTLNPTSCDPMSVGAEAVSVPNQVAALANRFQVGGCRGLDFKPKLSLRLFGPTRRGGNPRLRAVVTARPGEANIARAAVTLPHSEFLDQSHIRTICTRVQFAAGGGGGEKCPPGSVYGHARAFSPLLDHPLEGPVFLRANGGERELPDLVAVLKGPASQPIEIDLVGFVDSVRGGIRNRFELVPDAPVSKFVLEMKGGRKGLLENSTNICRGKHRAVVKMDAHNGKFHDTKPLVRASCGKKGARRASLRHRRGRGT